MTKENERVVLFDPSPWHSRFWEFCEHSKLATSTVLRLLNPSNYVYNTVYKEPLCSLYIHDESAERYTGYGILCKIYAGHAPSIFKAVSESTKVYIVDDGSGTAELVHEAFQKFITWPNGTQPVFRAVSETTTGLEFYTM